MKYRLTSQQIASKVANEMVILNHEKGYYYSLDEVGVKIWETLEEGEQDINEIVNHVCELYEVERVVCEADVKSLLQDLVSQNLVEIVES